MIKHKTSQTILLHQTLIIPFSSTWADMLNGAWIWSIDHKRETRIEFHFNFLLELCNTYFWLKIHKGSRQYENRIIQKWSSEALVAPKIWLLKRRLACRQITIKKYHKEQRAPKAFLCRLINLGSKLPFLD